MRSVQWFKQINKSEETNFKVTVIIEAAEDEIFWFTPLSGSCSKNGVCYISHNATWNYNLISLSKSNAYY